MRIIARLLGTALVVALGSAADGGQTVSVTVSPPTASVPANGTRQFSATVTGSTDTAVTWLVNGVRGGAPSIGLIGGNGLYTAPADVAAPLSVTVEATAAAAPAATGQASIGVAASTWSGPGYHVATTGKDTNPGTAASPWRTIQHAVGAVPAGATIQVASGIYNELVTITRSGSAVAGFITLEPEAGAAPVIDGTGLGIPNGQNGLVTIDNASYVRLIGFEIRNYVSQSAANVPIGIYVEGAGSHVELLHNHVHNITTTVTTSAGDALGIAVYGTSAPASISRLIIDGNELDHLTTGFSESLSLSGNVIFWQVTNNLIHNNDNIGINVEGFYQTSPQVAYDQARDGLVAGNTVYGITSKNNPAYGGSLGADGIYISGGTSVTVQQNLVYETDIGIEMASEIPGRTTSGVLTHDNVVYHSFVTGISIGGADRTQNGGTTGCIIANNTLFENDTTQSGSGEFQIQYNASHNVFEGNVVVANAQGLLVDNFASGSTPPASIDHNLYDSSAGTSGSQFLWLGKTYTGFAAWQAATGLDRHSLFANPQFADQAVFDFALTASSPAIGLGEVLGLAGTGLVDFVGDLRVSGTSIDAGAYEH